MGGKIDSLEMQKMEKVFFFTFYERAMSQQLEGGFKDSRNEKKTFS